MLRSSSPALLAQVDSHDKSVGKRGQKEKKKKSRCIRAGPTTTGGMFIYRNKKFENSTNRANSARVAQSVERQTLNLNAASSSLAVGSIPAPANSGRFLSFCSLVERTFFSSFNLFFPLSLSNSAQ